MKKIIGIGILFFFLTSCGYLFQLENDKKLAEKIETELNSENGTVDFAKVTDFEWDSLIILGPYSVVDEIEKEFNLKEMFIEVSAMMEFKANIKDLYLNVECDKTVPNYVLGDNQRLI